MDKVIEEIDEALDFSSWFDLWHTHLDWNSEGQNDWGVRQQFLTRLLALYEHLNQRMLEHGRVYQAFCTIDLEDSGADAVYLHTENPNRENYPFKFEEVSEVIECEYPLPEFIEAQGYNWRALKGAKALLIYKEGLGEDLF